MKNSNSGVEENLSPQPKLQEVEELTRDLKKLLVNHELTLDQDGVLQEVETLEQWMESYRRGLSAAHKISEYGLQKLCNLRDHLKLAAEERQRLEAEGGSTLSTEQLKQTDELLETARHIDMAIPDIEQMFTQEQEHA